MQKRPLLILLAFLQMVLMVSPVIGTSAAQAAAQVGTTASKMPIYREQDPSSEIMGAYPAGFRVRYEQTSDAAWVKILFSRPFKGANFGFARASALGAPGAGASVASAVMPERRAGRSAGGALDRYRGSIGVGAENTMASPSAMLTQLEEATGAMTVMQLRLNVNYTVSPKWILYGHVGSESFTHSDAGGIKTLYGSGFGGALGMQYIFLNKRFMGAALGAGLGSHLYSASTEKDGLGATTSSIFGVEIEAARLTLMVPLFSSIGLDLNAGYQIKTLPQVTIVTGGTLDNPTTSPADVNLGGMFFGGNLTWNF